MLVSHFTARWKATIGGKGFTSKGVPRPHLPGRGAKERACQIASLAVPHHIPQGRPRVAAEDVAPISHRVDQAGAVRLQFAAQFHDVNFEGVRQPVKSLVPNLFVDSCARYDFATVTHEEH